MKRREQHLNTLHIPVRVILLVALAGLFSGQVMAANKWDPDFVGRMGQDVWKQNKGAGSQGQKWYAFCNKNSRNIELGKTKPNNNYLQMGGPFNNEPAARNWVNSSCSSWRCDWNGRCVRPATGTGGGSKPCPPGTYRDEGLFGQGSGKCVPY